MPLWCCRANSSHNADPGALPPLADQGASVPGAHDAGRYRGAGNGTEYGKARRCVTCSRTDRQLRYDVRSSRPDQANVLDSSRDLRGVGLPHRILKIAAACGDRKRFSLDLPENLPKSVDGLEAPDLCDVFPGQVSDPRYKERQRRAMSPERGAGRETGTDHSAMQPIDADIPASGPSSGEILADMVDQAGTNEVLRHEPVERYIAVVAALPAVSELLERRRQLTRTSEDDPVAPRRKLVAKRLEGREPADRGLRVEYRLVRAG